MSEYVWYSDLSKQFMEKDYLLPGQTLDDRVQVIINAAESRLGIPGFAEKLKSYIQRGWYTFATPIWTNYGTDRGSPISCFGSYISDNMESILDNLGEIGMMSKEGGGTSAYFGKIRPRGSIIRNNGTTHGSVHFMQLFDNMTNIVSQGSSRRGQIALYQDIWHDDIEEFLTLRKEGSPIQDASYGVNVSDEWLNEMIAGDVKKRRIWAKVLEARANTGYPYILFVDNANKNTVDVYKDKGMRITHSNLCNEIMLSDNEEESFVCCLSSMNISRFDEWKDTDAVEVLVYFLDTVLSEFIDKNRDKKYMQRAVRFSERQRAIGIGWVGYHTYLQSKMIPFESSEALLENLKIAENIKKASYKASEKMAREYGEPELLKGYGRRHTTLMAIAPTKSSAFIGGQISEGIEPHRTNYYIKDLAKGKFPIKNKELENFLESKGHNTKEVWDSILKNSGSVQHLDILTPEERAVFKTFIEMSPAWIVQQAADRQLYIDQGQSLNLMINPKTPTKEVNALILDAWRKGVKGLYYQISVNAAQELTRTLDCVSCSA